MTERSIRSVDDGGATRATGAGDGIARLLGVRFSTLGADRVVAAMTLSPDHLDGGGAVAGGVFMALADCAGRAGAARQCPAGRGAAMVDAKTTILHAGAGGALRAEARPMRGDDGHAIWRVELFRGAGGPCAEVTQTWLFQPAAPTTASAPAGDVAALPRQREPAPASMTDTAAKTGTVVDLRRRQIFEAACDVIARKGFAKATIREIAAAADMPVPTMYQYLERKEDLLYEIYDYFMRDIVAAVEAQRATPAAPAARIEAVLDTLIRAFDRNHRYLKIMFQETRALTPEDRRKVYELDARYIALLAGLLDEAGAVEPLAVDNAELAANIIYFLCVLWPLRYWTIGKFGDAAARRQIIDFALRGLGMAAPLTSNSAPIPERQRP